MQNLTFAIGVLPPMSLLESFIRWIKFKLNYEPYYGTIIILDKPTFLYFQPPETPHAQVKGDKVRR